MRFNTHHMIAAVFAILFSFPFIASNIYYVDDIYRSMTGFGGWTGMGRPGADILNSLFSLEFGSTVDVAPLTQIFSAILLFLSYLLCGKSLSINKYSIYTFAFLPIIINPFFIQNMAYRYDSFSMAFAVFSVCASFYYSRKPGHINLLSSVLLSVISLCMYQSALNIFIGITATAIIFDADKYQKMSANLLRSSAIFIASNVAYLSLMNITGINTSGRGVISLTGLSERVIDYILYFVNSIGFEEFKFFAFYLTMSYFAIFIIIFKNKQNKKPKALELFVLISSPLAALLSIFGALPLIENQSPQARLLTGAAGFFVFFGVSISVVCSFAAEKIGRLFNPTYIMIVVAIYLVSLPYSFVNAQKKQTEFDLNVVHDAVSDIRKNFSENDYDKITTLGGTPKVRQVFVNSRNTPLIKDIVSSMYDFTSSLYLKEAYLNNVYFDFNRSRTKSYFDKNKHLSHETIVSERYSIYNINGTLYVVFNTEW
ncbi:glucosyltransferase domain-containing protein [Enterobacter hormaechei]|nr:glucosyltransferase domain-containing protein [Enterobacter hormaechei]MCM6986037.1 glucosyltransferase domain-containing protein [Enterobacter hormaechei]MCM7056139.1 glucosyltransferase domain-containing protein [Enterobacter hormaechei]